MKISKGFKELYIVALLLLGLSFLYCEGWLLLAITIFLVATIGLFSISEFYIQKRIQKGADEYISTPMLKIEGKWRA